MSLSILAVLAGVLTIAACPGGSFAQATRASVKDLELRVSPNGRHFVDQHGKPFFYLGDTAWLIFQRLDRAEVDEYLKDRAAKGFTVIQAYVLRGLEARHPDGSMSLAGATPLVDRDPTQLNEAFFKNVDHVIRRANELGMVVALVVAKSWHINEHPERVFNVENAHVFGKVLGERYRGDAVMWYVGGDSVPGKDEAIWVSMAKGLKDGSGGRHLVSYHGSGQTTSATWFHQASWLDFNSIQSGHGWGARTYRFIASDYALSPTKPTVDMEPPYENHPTGSKSPRIDSHQVRQGAYWAMLAGAAGHGYGALDNYYLYKEGDGPFPRDGFQPWRRAIAYEGSRQVGLMRRLFTLRPLVGPLGPSGPSQVVPEVEEDNLAAIVAQLEALAVLVVALDVRGRLADSQVTNLVQRVHGLLTHGAAGAVVGDGDLHRRGRGPSACRACR
jgi:hypothetical protein